MNINVRRWAKRTPVPIKKGLKFLYGMSPQCMRYPYTSVFSEHYRFLQASQWWGQEKIHEYQTLQLQKLLNHAYDNVPYYRTVFDERGLKPLQICSYDDLKKLPYLTKDIIREKTTDLVAGNYLEANIEKRTTGGSTGDPLSLFFEKGVWLSRELAFVVTLWERVGYKVGNRILVLRGDIVPSAQRGKFWEYHRLNNRLILSSYHINEENVEQYVRKINQFNPHFIHSYPSAVALLAKLIKESNIRLKVKIRAVLCASENLYPSQRELIQEVFNCRVFDLYGHTEQAVIAGECEESSMYHLMPEYGITEIIDSEGMPVNEEGTVGEIVATGFLNYIFPLIRYRTGDCALYSKSKCRCGRKHQLLHKIEGRIQDIVYTKDGRHITLTALIFSQHFDAFSRVQKMQLVQDKKGELQVKIIKESRFTNDDEKEIRSKIEKAVQGDLRVFFQYVDTIPLTQRGKHKFLIQNIRIQD